MSLVGAATPANAGIMQLVGFAGFVLSPSPQAAAGGGKVADEPAHDIDPPRREENRDVRRLPPYVRKLPRLPFSEISVKVAQRNRYFLHRSSERPIMRMI